MGLWGYLGKLSHENIYGLITVLGRDFSRWLIKVYCSKITHNSKAVPGRVRGLRGVCVGAGSQPRPRCQPLQMRPYS